MKVATIEKIDARLTGIESKLSRKPILTGEARKEKINELILKYLSGLERYQLHNFWNEIEAPVRNYITINPDESNSEKIERLAVSYFRNCSPEVLEDLKLQVFISTQA